MPASPSGRSGVKNRLKVTGPPLPDPLGNVTLNTEHSMFYKTKVEAWGGDFCMSLIFSAGLNGANATAAGIASSLDPKF